jgi:hypothetical protein
MSNKPKSLDTIIDRIQKLERGNIFAIGDLLIEAKDQVEYGNWGTWLRDNLEYSPDTAARYIGVAKLGQRFRNLRNLKLGVTTLYSLVDLEEQWGRAADDEDDLACTAVVIDELEMWATKERQPPRFAANIIKAGIGRYIFDQYPDLNPATYAALQMLLEKYRTSKRYNEAVVVLAERNLNTFPDAYRLADQLILVKPEPVKDEDKDDSDDGDQDDQDQDEDQDQGEDQDEDIKDADLDEKKDEDKFDPAKILDGSPPLLPPPSPPGDPQKFESETDWAEAGSFKAACQTLYDLRTKPVARFVGQFNGASLLEISGFLEAVSFEPAKPSKKTAGAS